MTPSTHAMTVVALLSAVPLAPFQDSYNLVGFDISVSRTAEGAALTCKAGCAWRSLAFPVKEKPTAFNENGMVDRTGNPEKAGRFLIRLGTTAEGFALTCERGCAWRTLGWTVPADGSAVRINEYGMTPREVQRK